MDFRVKPFHQVDVLSVSTLALSKALPYPWIYAMDYANNN
jgi:hypothetical protein